MPVNAVFVGNSLDFKAMMPKIAVQEAQISSDIAFEKDWHAIELNSNL